ncbi:MAG: MaoC family dehydratase [Rhodospirillaceae bacterium]|nr:MaoC family dehydratase [Rhodospirillaceae bacterium]
MSLSLIEGVPYHIDNCEAYVGMPLGESDWMSVDQTRINMFGEATEDRNPLHVDPEWAAENGPFGSTIAHGFLTLSMMTHLSSKGVLQPAGVDYAINLGFERVRFLAPVMVDDRIKMLCHLLEVKPRGAGKWRFKSRCSIIIEKTGKTALNAIWLVLFVNMKLSGEDGQSSG